LLLFNCVKYEVGEVGFCQISDENVSFAILVIDSEPKVNFSLFYYAN